MSTKNVLHYIGPPLNWPIFPCSQDKRPLTMLGFHDATNDFDDVMAWLHQDASCLWGVPTGHVTGLAVLDIDIKPGANGFDTLERMGLPLMGRAIFPFVPFVHTRSGGVHLYFKYPEGGLRNTAGARGRGIGPGLDWRGDGGYVIIPTPGSGYEWDTDQNFDTCRPVPVPPELLPREPKPEPRSALIEPCVGLSPYADRAINSACDKIKRAPCGEQEATLNAECYSIGTLVGAGAAPHTYAFLMLMDAAKQMTSYDARRPWRRSDVVNKVDRAFMDGLRNPRASGRR